MGELAAGFRLGRFEILSDLGGGGMGDVYLGRDAESGEQVAVKTLHSRFAGDAEVVPRFVREAEVYRRLHHPNIVRYLGSGIREGVYWIALEHVRGRTLEELLAKVRGPLGVERAVLVATDLLGALAHAHSRGVVHRDIKPRNVMVSSHGEVKLLDFGVAAADDLLVETAEGMVLGSFRYSSPEQNQGQEVDARTDLYSLGLVLWEMLTGRRALEGASLLEVTQRQILTGIPPPSSVVPSVPPGLDRLCERLTRKYRNERPETAEAALAELAGSGAPG